MFRPRVIPVLLLKDNGLVKTVGFKKPVYVGDSLSIEGTVSDKLGRHEALMEGRIYKEDDVCCASATGTFAVFSPAVAKRLSITDNESLKWFEQIFNLR